MKKKIYFVIGPTSSGKTDLAIEVVKSLGKKQNGDWVGEIVGADSRQILKGFDLTSGKATHTELYSLGQEIKHHLLSCIIPGTYFSVIDYENLAMQTIEGIWENGGVPIVCGGTGQYIDAIFYKQNLPEMKVNESLRKELNEKDLQSLQIILQDLDKSVYKKVDVNNKVRVARAIEIIKTIGHYPDRNVEERFGKDVEVVIINTARKFDRDTLRSRIETRFRRRLDEGMVEEVKRDKQQHNLSSEYLENLGLEYRYISQYIDGKISYELMVQLLVFETRKYARRQETWFRKYK